MCEIDNIILRHSTRGMKRIYCQLHKELCRPAATAFFALKRGRVFLYTGFYAGGKGETDGPPGAFFLYRAMTELGFSPLIITDRCCNGYFPDCEVLFIDKGEDNPSTFAALLARENPVAHFAIERLGRNRHGQYLSHNGTDLAACTPFLDLLFEMATTPTFAIGDGGNEIGMGTLAHLIEQTLSFLPAITPCDYPVIASVSNWGAYGFLAALSLSCGKVLLPSFAEVENFLRHIVSCGAVDGISLANTMSVDSKDILVDKEILAALLSAIQP